MLIGTMNQTQDNNKSRHQQVFLFVLIGLLILRIPFFAGMLFFNIRWEWTGAIFEIGTYLLTTFLIWWELDNLVEYHFDTLAVIMVILFKPIQTLILKYWGFNDHPLTFPSIPSLIVWLIAIVFIIGIWRKRSKLPGIKPINLGWLFIGALAGLATTIVLSFPMSFQVPIDAMPSHSLENAFKDVLREIPSSFIYQIGYAAVSEEPLFRGFLWGFLKKLNWREHWIWLFQAGLFTFAHIFDLRSAPISFWVIVPVCSLVLGWLAWRSRTIASSLAAHGMMNATGYAFGYLMALYRIG